MKIALCATHLEKMILPQDREYIGVDHGVEELLKQGITPKFAIGDFDSLQNRQTLENLNIQILPERKDVTDTHAAIEYAISKGYDEIELYGVTGGRLDHFFAVMCLLEKYQDVSIKVIDQQNCIQLLKPGIHHIYNQEYYYFSLKKDETARFKLCYIVNKTELENQNICICLGESVVLNGTDIDRKICYIPLKIERER